jgi:endonuclease/exonuclease/phosphatase family metal-dependent hydrolase
MRFKNGVLVVLIIGIAYLLLEGFPDLDFEKSKVDESNKSFYSLEIIDSKDSLTIGSFNIQTFGTSKSSKDEVMDVLANIACDFDLLAIQEIRDKSGATPIFFAQKINNTCNGSFGFVLSPRLGRTISKENYMFIFDKQELDFIKNSDFVIGDEDDIFEREPFVARFKSKNKNNSFFALNIHIKPDDATNELKALSIIANQILEKEKNIILMGDLNADCSYFNEDLREKVFSKEFNWIIPKQADTTIKNSFCTYDQILVSKELFKKQFGTGKVFYFDKTYNLNYTTSIKVSDHYPVWAEFDI